MKKLQAFLIFYKGIFVLPLVISFWLISLKTGITLEIITKLLIFGLIWLFKYIADRKDEKFFFYYNLGIPKLHLFVFAYFTDFLLFLIISKLL